MGDLIITLEGRVNEPPEFSTARKILSIPIHIVKWEVIPSLEKMDYGTNFKEALIEDLGNMKKAKSIEYYGFPLPIFLGNMLRMHFNEWNKGIYGKKANGELYLIPARIDLLGKDGVIAASY